MFVYKVDNDESFEEYREWAVIAHDTTSAVRLFADSRDAAIHTTINPALDETLFILYEDNEYRTYHLKLIGPVAEGVY